MKKTLLPIAALFLVAACASGPTVVEPQFHIRVVEVPESLPFNANPFATMVEVDVRNRGDEPLVLQRIDIMSVGQGRYTVIPVTQTYNQAIPPRQTGTFPVRVQVIAEETIGMAEEPIHIRGVIVFDTREGAFRRSFMQRVNPSTLQ